jgi:hypothetical protein
LGKKETIADRAARIQKEGVKFGLLGQTSDDFRTQGLASVNNGIAAALKSAGNFKVEDRLGAGESGKGVAQSFGMLVRQGTQAGQMEKFGLDTSSSPLSLAEGGSGYSIGKPSLAEAMKGAFGKTDLLSSANSGMGLNLSASTSLPSIARKKDPFEFFKNASLHGGITSSGGLTTGGLSSGMAGEHGNQAYGMVRRGDAARRKAAESEAGKKKDPITAVAHNTAALARVWGADGREE